MQMALFADMEQEVITAPVVTKTKPKKITDSLELVEAIDPSVLNELRSAQVRNGVVILMPELPRNLYEQCDEVLGRLRGKWNRNAGGHVFPFEPQVTESLFASMLESGRQPAKNPLALFFTPDAVIDELVQGEIAERLDFWQQYRDEFDLGPMRILEPSAGTGAISCYIRERWPDVELHLVEQDPINVDLLHNLGFENVHHGDFMEYRPDVDFAAIVMNPPFSVGGKDCYQDHITKAFSHLRNGGLLAAVAPTGWTWHTDSKSRAFLNWVALHGGWWDLPAESFKESGTLIKTVGIYLDYDPHWDNHRKQPYYGYRNFDEWLLRLHADCDYDYHRWEWQQLERVRKGRVNLDLAGLPADTKALLRWRQKLEGVRIQANKMGDGFVMRNLDADLLIAEAISDHLAYEVPLS